MLEECSPSFSSSRTARKPLAPRRTTNALGRPPARASRAKTVKTWAWLPFVIHCFVPVRRSCSSAEARIAAASEPDSDSVRAKAASSWPWASGGTRRRRWSSVPCATIGSVPAPVCTASVTPRPASARESSSSTSA